MRAYNRSGLYNLYAHEQFNDAFTNNVINADQYKELMSKSPVGFYTPNIFIRIGLGLLTIVIILFTTALLAMVGGVNFEALSAYMFIMGVLSYIVLELMVNAKNHYNSGVDNILLIAVAIFLTSGLQSALEKSGVTGDILNCLFAFALCTYLAWRFSDALMASVATLSLVLALLYVLSTFMPVYLFYLPAIAFCFLIYRIATKATKQDSLLLSQFLFKTVAVTALVLMYLAGNMYMVDECSSMFFGEHAIIPQAMKGIYWAITLLLPVAYIVAGVYHKNIVLIRLGVILSAVAALTFRHYFSVLSVEAALIGSGALLVILTYAIIRYLKEPRHGFTFQPEAKAKGELDLEDLITEKIVNRAAQ